MAISAYTGDISILPIHIGHIHRIIVDISFKPGDITGESDAITIDLRMFLLNMFGNQQVADGLLRVIEIGGKVSYGW